MSDTQFISDLSSIYANIRKVDAKKINLKGKNILDYISDSEFNSYDTRDQQLKNDELDIWNTAISLSEEGHIEVKPFEHTYEEMTDEQKDLLLMSAAQVIDNEVLDLNGNHLMYWQTNGLTNAYYAIDKDNDGEDDVELSIFWHYEYSDNPLSNFNLTSFSSDLSSLTYGINMFEGCSNLTSFSSDLSSLTNGVGMFCHCSNLNTFSSDLSSLTEGSYMFEECSALTSFTSDLSSLTIGGWMFCYCDNLASFSSDLSSLEDAEGMFSGCTNLTTFSSDLSNLMYGSSMFSECKLDAQSVANIVHFIPQMDAKPITTGDGNITIGIGITNTEEAKQAFAEELDCVDWADLNNEFDDKNWVVEWQFNGPASYSLRDPRPSTAVFAKLEEAIMPIDKKAHKPHYRYTSADGSKFYNIHWYHESNVEDESYTLFDSLEAAIEAFGVVPVNQH